VSIKNRNDHIGNRTRNLQACSSVPQPTAPPHARISVYRALRTDTYIKRVFITVVESVYSAVGADSLYKAGFNNRGGKCLQRGTE
jgi:hypothetical protein